MNIEFKRFSEFPRGTVCELLRDGYSFDSRYERDWIASSYKGNRYGKMQLQEAVHRIAGQGVNKIIVTTDEQLVHMKYGTKKQQGLMVLGTMEVCRDRYHKEFYCQEWKLL